MWPRTLIGVEVSGSVDATEVSLLVEVFFLPEFNGFGFANSITCSLTYVDTDLKMRLYLESLRIVARRPHDDLVKN